MFGALTSVLARECKSVVTGRMAGALFAGESNSWVANGGHFVQHAKHAVVRTLSGALRVAMLLILLPVPSVADTEA